MDKKYIVGLVFAVVLLGSAGAVAVRVVLHGRSSVPVKGLTSSASEPTKADAPKTTPAVEQSLGDFVLPVEKTVTSVSLTDVPKAVISLLGDTQDARAYSVEYANGSKGYRVERDIAQSLTQVSSRWQTAIQTADISARSKVSEDQALYQTQSGGYKILVTLSRLTSATTGQSVAVIPQ